MAIKSSSVMYEQHFSSVCLMYNRPHQLQNAVNAFTQEIVLFVTDDLELHENKSLL